MQKFGLLDVAPGPVHVIDGDSLRRGDVEIRLYGIDAPEYRQTCRNASRADYPCGQTALQALRGLVGTKDWSCTALDTDRYGRAVSVCARDGVELNAEMVRMGWAVAYGHPKVAYAGIENEARRLKRGLWAGTFELPEAYRARHRSVRGNMGDDGEMLPPD